MQQCSSRFRISEKPSSEIRNRPHNHKRESITTIGVAQVLPICVIHSYEPYLVVFGSHLRPDLRGVRLGHHLGEELVVHGGRVVLTQARAPHHAARLCLASFRDPHHDVRCGHRAGERAPAVLDAKAVVNGHVGGGERPRPRHFPGPARCLVGGLRAGRLPQPPPNLRTRGSIYKHV
eukprot:64192-Prorocentrum_minimum.AAC.2